MQQEDFGASRPRRRGAAAVLLTALVSLALGLASPTTAFARYNPNSSVTNPLGPFTEVVTTTTGDERHLTLSNAYTSASLDPLLGYPSALPADAVNLGFIYAGTLGIVDPDGRTGLAYCIDLSHETEDGLHYRHGNWTEANIPHMGYVEYILTHYYPHIPALPAGITDNQRAAVVQAAIWFFTDNVVLAPGVLHDLAAGIVIDALAHGPSPEPPTPQLSVSPSHLAAPATGEIVGPFTVTADGPATITINGIEVFTDRAGTHRLQDGDVVQPGARLWARSVSDLPDQGFVLTRSVFWPIGTVYLYDHTNPGFDEAQKLVLAQIAELAEKSGATLEPFAAGALSLTKEIRGSAAGRQGAIKVTVRCPATENSPAAEHVVTFPAGAPAGRHTRVITGLPAGAVCTITETSDGGTAEAHLVSVRIVPTSVTISTEETAHATITDTYNITRPVPPAPPKRLPVTG